MTSNFGNVPIEKAMIEKTYDGVCCIFEFIPSVQSNGETLLEPSERESQIACALSKKKNRINVNALTNENEDVDAVGTLFLSPDVVIKAGDRILISQYGVSNYYTKTGEPMVYATHQEVAVSLVKTS